MVGEMGLALALVAGIQQPASIRIDLTAYVPVTCSAGGVVASRATGAGMEFEIEGSCNADHLVRVFVPAASGAALLNGQPGYREVDGFTFQRDAYFAGRSRLDIADAGAIAAVTVEISPL